MPGEDPAVVIGAGMGGLAAAIRLAARGIPVTLVEMAEAPGGKARAVATPAGPADTGPTVLTLRAALDDLFALAGTRTEDELDLVALPRLARHFWPDGSRLDLFPDREANAAAIADFAGAREAAAFRRFDRLTAGLMAAFRDPVMAAPRPQPARILAATLRRPALWPALLPGLSLDALLRRYFRDPRLVQLFGRYATYVGGRPARTPAVLSLVWQAEQAGVWAARGGMHGVAAALARVATRLGVRFRYGVRAERIVLRDGRVVAVDLDGGERLPCRACVFNGDPGALRQGLLGADAAAALPGAAPKPSLSAWVWAFAATPKGSELAHHNIFFTDRPEEEFGPIGEGRMPRAATLYLCAQDREMGRPVPEVERFEIIMNGPAGQQQLGTDEEAKCRARTFPPLAAQGLTFDPAPGARALTSPAVLARRYPGSQGAIYGMAPEGATAAFRRPLARTRAKGLYLAGGGAHPGAGVPMALTSGTHAAEALAADLTSGWKSGRTAMPGGMSTASPTTGRAPSR
jgi:1-hydroxycarotenoid 3,4-desaturase